VNNAVPVQDFFTGDAKQLPQFGDCSRKALTTRKIGASELNLCANAQRMGRTEWQGKGCRREVTLLDERFGREVVACEGRKGAGNGGDAPDFETKYANGLAPTLEWHCRRTKRNTSVLVGLCVGLGLPETSRRALVSVPFKTRVP